MLAESVIYNSKNYASTLGSSLTISYYTESGIWLGKILVNDNRFTKFAEVFPCQSFALYGSAVTNTTIFIRHKVLFKKLAKAYNYKNR